MPYLQQTENKFGNVWILLTKSKEHQINVICIYFFHIENIEYI